jgi:3-deoxy-D-manno-octulosonic-acid transferase
MRAAIHALRPRAIVFSKLDVWPELVRQAKRGGIRVGIISATMAEGSARRSRAAHLLLGDAYGALDAVGAVDEADADRLVELGVRREIIEVTGDTRFDQVLQRADAVDRSSGLIARLQSDRPTLVAGSTWPADERVLLDGIVRARRRVPTLRLIIAPHEPTPEHLEPIERWAANAALTVARIDDQAAAEADVGLVDRFGVLGELYALANVAFVGGAFHDLGLHSVLEPASFGAPVLFGPKHHKIRDAATLLRANAARVVHDAAEVERTLVEWFENSTALGAAGAQARATVERGKGAAERSLRLVERLMSA